MRRESWTRLASCLWIAVTLIGCAAGSTGYRISEETVAFIRPGVTTREEVVENLGPPLYELPTPHVYAYSWGKVHAVSGKTSAQEQAITPGQSGYATAPPPTLDEAPSVEARRWIFCIAMDEHDVVTRFGTFELPGAGSLENAVRLWAAKEK